MSNNCIGVFNPVAMTNCVIYFNNNNQNYDDATGNSFSHCCTTPAPPGTGNFTAAPTFFADGVHPANNSPCVGAGVYIGGGTDIFGEAYSNPPSVGCAEWTSAPLAGAPQITLTGSPVGFAIGNFAFAGATPSSYSWLQNGQPLVDNGHFSGTQSSNLFATGVSIADAGNYQVVISNAFGAVTSAVVALNIHCVNGSGNNSIAPYSSWAAAAINIQDAIAASVAGDVVLVTNGLYNSGGESTDGQITNRVCIDRGILVQSVNGPAVTVIQGAWDPTSTNGPGAVRCIWMTNNAILSGFTIAGGATRAGSPSGTIAMYGGGILAESTNSTISGCILVTNMASLWGGGVYAAGNGLHAAHTTLINCKLIGNQAVGTYGINGNGGGAYNCNLQNCILLNNVAENGSGGGAYNCNLKNSALIANSAYSYGTAADGGTLINCTVISNSVLDFTEEDPAIYGATLTNCIVIDNTSSINSPTNYAGSTLAYCCADPLPPGPGNIDVNPEVLADGFHLAQTSPCIGAGISAAVSGTDIDGQSWNNPPSIGCDEWSPKPLVIVQPAFQAGFSPHDLTWNVAVAGQPPFTCFWSQDGVPIQDDGHHSNSTNVNMTINDFGPADGGIYQVIITNSSGSVTSAPVQLAIHTVDASGSDPLPPYSSWATAATTIQDAVNSAVSGDVVLVTNGTYSNGGMAVSGSLTNRVALNKAITVMSVNGFKATIIQGAWEPVSTNGPGAVRCAWLGNGAILNGFTLQNGATFATGDSSQYGPLESGGGAYCVSSNALVLNCELTNNAAVYGGGAALGTVDNSLIIANIAEYGGGALLSSLNNCTVLNNVATGLFPGNQGGAGTCSAIVRNSIVIDNYDVPYHEPDDAYYLPGSGASINYAYSCSSGLPLPLPSGAGNTTADPVFVDLYHISTFSPCYGTGSAAYTTGCDLDNQPWNNPPSMGCSEIVLSNLVGPLSVSCSAEWTNVVVGHFDGLQGILQGRAAYISWSFGDGPTYSNLDYDYFHQWTTSGVYSVTFTAYNNDNPGGVSATVPVNVEFPVPANIQWIGLVTNGFLFQFASQMDADYTVQYCTNLTVPIWQTWQQIYFNNQTNIQILDPSGTNGDRFYRVITR